MAAGKHWGIRFYGVMVFAVLVLAVCIERVKTTYAEDSSGGGGVGGGGGCPYHDGPDECCVPGVMRNPGCFASDGTTVCLGTGWSEPGIINADWDWHITLCTPRLDCNNVLVGYTYNHMADCSADLVWDSPGGTHLGPSAWYAQQVAAGLTPGPGTYLFHATRAYGCLNGSCSSNTAEIGDYTVTVLPCPSTSCSVLLPCFTHNSDGRFGAVFERCYNIPDLCWNGIDDWWYWEQLTNTVVSGICTNFEFTGNATPLALGQFGVPQHCWPDQITMVEPIERWVFCGFACDQKIDIGPDRATVENGGYCHYLNHQSLTVIWTNYPDNNPMHGTITVATCGFETSCSF